MFKIILDDILFCATNNLILRGFERKTDPLYSGFFFKFNHSIIQKSHESKKINIFRKS